jgi:hypothetical protein
MPDLDSMLLRRSLDSLTSGGATCSECERTPLPGEGMHEMDTGRILCDLCLARIPEDDRRAVRSERVHASERHLAVVRRAA